MLLRLAILSDLHIGRGARCADLCPPDDRSSMPNENFQSRFLSFLEDQLLPSAIDYVIVPGDLTSRAQPTEVKHAVEFILSVCSTLRVPQDRVLWVPGNHDVDWSVFDPADTTGYRKAQRYGPLSAQVLGLPRLGPPNSSLLTDPFFLVKEYPDLLFVGYNSAHHDAPDNALHHGLVTVHHLHALERALSAVPRRLEQIRLFVVHHHPQLYNEPLQDMQDFSAMQNAESLVDFLHRQSFDFVAHGHRHFPRFKMVSHDSAAPIPVLCSGSLSVALDTRWAGAVTNQFHVVEFHQRDGAQMVVTGRVKSWAFTSARGWEPSKEKYTGISHTEPFGPHVVPAALYSIVHPVVMGLVNDVNHCDWASVLDRVRTPDLRYLRPRLVMEVLSRIASQEKLRILGDLDDGLFLVRQGDPNP